MTFVYTRRESFVMPMNITEFCSKLPAAHFRCHRSYCVNLNKIREIEPWFNNTYVLRLRDLEFQVPVSRSKVKEFRQLMNLNEMGDGRHRRPAESGLEDMPQRLAQMRAGAQ